MRTTVNDASKFIYKSRVNNGFSTVLQLPNDVDPCKSLPIYYVRKHIFLIHRDHSRNRALLPSKPDPMPSFLDLLFKNPKFDLSEGLIIITTPLFSGQKIWLEIVFVVH